MSNENRAGKVQTVTGLIDPEDLGVTLPHEHVLSDAKFLIPSGPEASVKEFHGLPVTADTVGLLRHYADVMVNADDFCLRDIDTAIEEVLLYRQMGGNAIVEVSSIGMGRDPVGLARISRATGVHFIMGGSYYVPSSHPLLVETGSEDELVEFIVRDVDEGVDGTGIKTGVIGEVGCNHPLTEVERKVLRASARAQKLTGAPLTIHPGRHVDAPLEILDIVGAAGTDLSRTIMDHLERTFTEHSEFLAVAESGCYLEWDLTGEERSFYDGNPKFDMPGDAARIAQIKRLVEDGYGDKLLISHDNAYKHRMVKYGGHGYWYILSHIVPRMRQRGLSEEAIRKLLVDNPARAFTFTEPRP